MLRNSPAASRRRAGRRLNTRWPKPYRNPFEVRSGQLRVGSGSVVATAADWPAWTDLPFQYQLIEGKG